MINHQLTIINGCLTHDENSMFLLEAKAYCAHVCICGSDYGYGRYGGDFLVSYVGYIHERQILATSRSEEESCGIATWQHCETGSNLAMGKMCSALNLQADVF